MFAPSHSHICVQLLVLRSQSDVSFCLGSVRVPESHDVFHSLHLPHPESLYPSDTTKSSHLSRDACARVLVSTAHVRFVQVQGHQSQNSFETALFVVGIANVLAVDLVIAILAVDRPLFDASPVLRMYQAFFRQTPCCSLTNCPFALPTQHVDVDLTPWGKQRAPEERAEAFSVEVDVPFWASPQPRQYAVSSFRALALALRAEQTTSLSVEVFAPPAT